MAWLAKDVQDLNPPGYPGLIITMSRVIHILIHVSVDILDIQTNIYPCYPNRHISIWRTMLSLAELLSRAELILHKTISARLRIHFRMSEKSFPHSPPYPYKFHHSYPLHKIPQPNRIISSVQWVYISAIRKRFYKQIHVHVHRIME